MESYEKLKELSLLWEAAVEEERRIREKYLASGGPPIPTPPILREAAKREWDEADKKLEEVCQAYREARKEYLGGDS